jgi:type VI secretion system protein ImpC
MAESKTAATQPATKTTEAPSWLTGEAKSPEDVSKHVVEKLGMRNDEQKEAARPGIQALIEDIIDKDSIVPEDVIEFVKQKIADIDEILDKQLNEILHAPEFQKLEGSWRGLFHMVNNTETDTKLKIKVLNVSREDLKENFKPGRKWDTTPLFHKIYTQTYGMFGGEPFGVLVSDLHFNHRKTDLDILKGMGKIAAAAHAPFIGGASPEIANMSDWRGLHNTDGIKEVFEVPEYAGWRSFRDSTDSKYVSLAMPRFLARLPYSVEEGATKYQFNEKVEGKDHAKYGWANASFAMATNITQAFKYYGWCSCIRGKQSGGLVPNLNVHTFKTADGGQDMKCPTEVNIDERTENELAELGFMALCHWKNSDQAAFLSARSVQKPKVYTDPDATANAKLSSSLDYLFAVCRFAHTLKVMVREAIGLFQEREDLEKWLNDWIGGYVYLGGDQDQKARFPLARAEVKVEEVPGNPGFYNATFWLRPHYKLEGLTADLCLVSKLPSIKGAK